VPKFLGILPKFSTNQNFRGCACNPAPPPPTPLAHVRLKDGRETTVSIRDLSPRSVRDTSPPSVLVPSPRDDDRHPDDNCISNEEDKEDTVSTDNSSADYKTQSPVRNDRHNSIVETSENTDPTTIPLRRSTRVRKPVDRYGVVPYNEDVLLHVSSYIIRCALHVSSYILRCATACVEFHVEGENVLWRYFVFLYSHARECICSSPNLMNQCRVSFCIGTQC